MTDMSTTPEISYRALTYAAEQIGANNWAAVPPKGKRAATRHRKPRMPDNWPSQAHRDVMDAALQVMSGEISPEEAMALLWRSDVEAERWASVTDR